MSRYAESWILATKEPHKFIIVWTCEDCAAVVRSTEKHDRYHETLEEVPYEYDPDFDQYP